MQTCSLSIYSLNISCKVTLSKNSTSFFVKSVEEIFFTDSHDFSQTINHFDEVVDALLAKLEE